METKQGKRAKFAIIAIISFSITTLLICFIKHPQVSEIFIEYSKTVVVVSLAFLGVQSYTDTKKKEDKNV